jgi:serine/threonine-protein kinase
LAGRYRLERELGRGGMAVVYLAHDLRHDRPVALKVLHSEFAHFLGSERFSREIRLAARLQHPHLLPVFDSGEADGSLFYVAPFVEGGSLRDRLDREGRLPIALALRLTREAAEALDYAHRHDVVHRDIKPENILLEDGHAVVADFGIARAISAAVQAAGPTTLTQTGLLIGTPSYMSPEQAGAEPLDGRSDVYSLGCVLFELVAGRRLFTGSSALEILAKRFTTPLASAQAAELPTTSAVRSVVSRALAVQREDRFPTARVMAEALAVAEADLSAGGARLPDGSTTVVTTSAPDRVRITTLAILPFTNLSAEPENEYFSDGVTEELINAFGRIEGLRVASRTSVFAMRARSLDVDTIGRQLNVGAVLEGSVRRAGTRVRLSARLVSVADGYQLWSETYDRQLADIFDVQDELARAIVAALRLRLVGPAAARLVRPATSDVEIYQLYLKGRFFSSKRTPDGLRKAIEHFERVIEADPNYALAHSGLADCYSMLGVYCVLPPGEAYPKAKAAARRALQLDDGLAEAHLSVAYVALVYEWAWAKAERECRRAIELQPSYAPAHHWLGWCLAYVGRLEEAGEAARRAMALEPLSPIIQSRASQILSYAGFPEEGVAGSLRALELDPGFFLALETLGSAYLHPKLHKYEEALAVAERLATYPLTSGPFLQPWILALMGERAEAERRLAQLQLNPEGERVPPGYLTMMLAGTYAALGDPDEAFRWLYRARDERLHAIALLKIEAAFDPLRGDPRFGELLCSVGLDQDRRGQ